MTTRTKSARLVGNSPPKPPTPHLKSGKDDNCPSPAWITRIEAKIENAMERITERLRVSEEQILNRISEITADLFNIKASMKEFAMRLVKTESECAQLEHIRKEMCELKANLAVITKNNISTDIIVSGIPNEKNENVGDIFGKLCKTMEINAPPVRAAFRVRSGKNNTKPAPLIIKLQYPLDRSLILKASAKFYKTNKRCFQMRDIGGVTDENVYLNECLTKANREVMQFATQLKKQNRLSTAYSFRGDVYVRVQSGSAAVKVLTKESLVSLLESNK